MMKNLHYFWFKSSFVFLLHHLLLLRSSALNTDGVALLSFKYSILSDPLSVLQTWNYNDETPCSWNGVICEEIENPDLLRVTSLVLPDSQLLGSISENLGMIQHLRRLDLSNNFLNGSLPNSLLNASELQVLSLANNVISGEVPPSIGELKSLRFLNLSDNAFAGLIPKNITVLKNLTFVSLKSNYFSGEVPGGFDYVQVLDLSSNLLNGSLPNNFSGEKLRYLNLSYNKISETIPPEFAKKFPGNSTIDLSFNNLAGPIPESPALMNQKTEFLSGNENLCGKPLKDLCSIPSTLSTPPNDTATASLSPAIAVIPQTIDTNPETNTTTSSTTTGNASSRNGLKPTTIVAIIVGDLVGVAILAIVVFFVYHQRIKPRNAERKEDPSVKNKTPSLHFSCLNPGNDSASEDTTTGSESESDEDCTKICMKTSDFPKVSLVTVDGETELDLESLLKASAYVLGTKGESIVYKAVLEDGRVFAVRRIGECGIERMREFENCVRSVAKIRHGNLVRVRGFCWGEEEKLVICDYVSNGSLAGSFGHRRGGGSSPLNLPLETRLKIAKGIARGLAFLHDKKYVHGNIKPSNILLNFENEPVISDFGLDRLRPTGSTQQAVPGSSSGTHQLSPHKAPESLQSLQPNPKWDVYSFGVVLLELLTGRVLLDQELDRPGSVKEENNRVLRMADVAIWNEVEGREEVVLVCLKLGFSCASFKPQKRPSMKEALQILEKIPSSSQ